MSGHMMAVVPFDDDDIEALFDAVEVLASGGKVPAETVTKLKKFRERRNSRLVEIEPVKEPASQKYTAQQVANNYQAAVLKDIAMTRGLSVKGGEVAVAQRLLDTGWMPDPVLMKKL